MGGRKATHVLKLTREFTAEELKTMYKKAAHKRTALRLQAIYLRALGKNPPEIAKIVGCHVETVRKWIKLFNQSGPSALEYEHSGGPAGKLSREQEKKLRHWLGQERPDGERWTLKALAKKLFEEFGVEISLQQIWQRLHRMGLRPLTPRPRFKNPDEAKPQTSKRLQ